MAGFVRFAVSFIDFYSEKDNWWLPSRGRRALAMPTMAFFEQLPGVPASQQKNAPWFVVPADDKKIPG